MKKSDVFVVNDVLIIIFLSLEEKIMSSEYQKTVKGKLNLKGGIKLK